jgi:flavin-binding protein dodecin
MEIISVLKVLELLFSSKSSWEHVAQKTITKASQSVRNI